METLDVLRRAPAGKPRLLVVLCHGVGADAHDLVGLAEPWAAAVPDAAFIAVDAPEPCDMAPFGRQWFSLQDRTPAVLQAGAARAAPRLDATIDAELARLSLPAERVVLMGFSQGAMTVLYSGLRRRPPPLGIMAYAGAMLAGPGLAQVVTGRPPVLLVHGQADEVSRSPPAPPLRPRFKPSASPCSPSGAPASATPSTTPASPVAPCFCKKSLLP